MSVYATARPAVIPTLPSEAIPVLIHAARHSHGLYGTIGHQLLEAIKLLPAAPSPAAYDFLTLALAVIASDTFVRRDDTPDSWSRNIDLSVELRNPALWEPLAGSLEKALGFLTGDQWHLTFAAGGPSCPKIGAKLTAQDSVCLFSGGLDSTLGALHLKSIGRRPLLVSQAYAKEGDTQADLAKAFGLDANHFTANADPSFEGVNETSMRARSLLFIAYGVVAASALAVRCVPSPVDVFIPENGFIALNAPLTLRRIGSHSTRTTHPHFLSQIRDILAAAGIPVRLINLFEFSTKGEMMRACADQATLVAHASQTVSCGKWKRKGKQCGRCFPCLIRRAAFHASGIHDGTDYRLPDLVAVSANIDEHDDLLAVRRAIQKAQTANLDGWVSLGGPLPWDRTVRHAYIDVFGRGLAEVSAYLQSVGCPA